MTRSQEDILYDFSVEPNHDQETLDRYLRLYPDYASELVDLSFALRKSRRIARLEPDSQKKPVEESSTGMERSE